MLNEASVNKRIDYLYSLMNKRILKFQDNILQKKYGLAEIEANNILQIKDLIRSNQIILQTIFNQEVEQDFMVN